MKKRRARKYFQRKWRQMKLDLCAYLKIGNHDSLHRFRVHFKQLHAFLVLYDCAGRGPKLLGELQPVEEVFKIAGKLRNGYIRHKTMHKPEHRFQAKADQFCSRLKKAHHRLKGKIKALGNIRINRFYMALLKKITKRISELKNDKNLHQCRKDIKVLLYNYPLVQDLLILSINSQYLDDLQEKIGKLRDQILKKKPMTDRESKSKNNDSHLADLISSLELLADDFYRRANRISAM